MTLSVLVVDDSVTSRRLMATVLRASQELVVVGECGDGQTAVELTQALRPDVVVMDIVMPGLDGIAATRSIMRSCPTPVVLVSAHFSDPQMSLAVEGMSAGALTAIEKPVGLAAEGAELSHRRFVRTVKAMAEVKVVRRIEPASAIVLPSVPPPAPTASQPTARIVAMAASTGGPGALAQVLGGLPPTLGIPVVVVQHIAVGFVEGMARWLRGVCALRVTVAVNGERLEPGTVYLAPDSVHLHVTALGTVRLSSAEPVGAFRPSATVLFESVAEAFGETAVGVILTGIGEDGVAGLRELRARGGQVIAQDEASSVVYGMPRAAVEAGVVDRVLPLDAIAAEVLRCSESTR